jgi:hypothetical protein
MIDPFFFDRLMHAFTTTNSTPLSQAAADQRTAKATGAAPACRAVREAEAVVAETCLRERTLPAETAEPDNHARGR